MKIDLKFCSLFLYSIFFEMFFSILLFISVFSMRLRRGVRGRNYDSSLTVPSRSPASDPGTVLFFCSSAGEYEQAGPLMDRYEHLGFRIAILFVSPSGVEFAEARRESRYYTLSPIDSLFRWKKVFDDISPIKTFVVRYELWPAFLYMVSKRCPVYLIDATAAGGNSYLNQIVKKALLKSFDSIFAVSKDDSLYFRSIGISENKINIVGDTKYDRVLEYRDLANLQKPRWDSLLARFGKEKKLILGSGWQKDVQLLLAAFRSRKNSSWLDGWLLIIVPHVVDEPMITWVKKEAESFGFVIQRLSQLEKTGFYESECSGVDVLVVDRIGLLAQLYSIADAAMVGGGLHYRVHNVLEPASFGLPVCFGPNYTTSTEAIELTKQSFGTVVNSEGDILEWWRRSQKNEKIQDWVKGLCGASDKIVSSTN